MELNKEKAPLISVIIAVFNRSGKLKRAVSSVLKQSFKNFEIIIVDDGSTDNPEKYVSELFKKYKNIKYIKHSNRNTPLSLNTGISIAGGKYITFLDSDDEYMPSHLAERILIFKKNKHIDLIHTTAKIYGSGDDLLIPDARNPLKLIHVEKCVIGATIFGKKNVFDSLKGFRDIYGYDYDFIKRCKKIFNVEKLDLPTYVYYRNSPDSILTKKKNKIHK